MLCLHDPDDADKPREMSPVVMTERGFWGWGWVDFLSLK